MNIILFGSPGSGKGTQAKMLSEYFKLKRISLGDILREEASKDSDLGKEIKKYMQKGHLVPDGLVSRLIEENIDEEDFILDGYPRNLNQAIKLEEILKRKSLQIDSFIYLDIDEKTVTDRLSKRWVCKKCGANYHLNISSQKYRCDLCKGELVQREDDSPQVIKNRWELFLKENRKLLDFYRSKNKLVEIEGRGSIEEVLRRVKEKLKCQKH